MPEHEPFPPSFDPNLGLNMFGPVPRPDGSLDSSAIGPTTTEDESDKAPMPSFTEDGFMQASSRDAASAGDASHGQDEQNGHNLNSGEYQDHAVHDSADTQQALNDLFSNPPTQAQLDPALRDTPHQAPPADSSTIDAQTQPQSQSQSQSQEPGDTDTANEDAASRKRKLGTPRINMLARGGACEFCKKRKLKCTAEVPTCQACFRMGHECVYSQKKQRSKVRMLEDRLAELEKKLDEPLGDVVGGIGAEGAGTDRVQTPVPEFWDRVASQGEGALGSSGAGETLGGIIVGGCGPSAPPSTELGFTFGDVSNWGAQLGSLENLGNLGDLESLGVGLNGNSVETTLMTLADAAASDVIPAAGYAWETMSEVDIASEMVKAVEGTKGIGEKIVGHLLQLYVNPQSAPSLHNSINPTSFLARLLPQSASPPHPALILALIPFLLPLSPSPALSTPDRSRKILGKLDTPARLHAQHALAVADSRLLDIVAANTIRASGCFEAGRLLEGWGDCNGAVALSWAAGLGKLGGIGGLLAASSGSESAMRLERDKRMKDVRYKTVLVEPPKNGRDLGQRIHLFWQVYRVDKASSVGWAFPPLINDEEVTTPFPRDNYDDPTALSDNTSIHDLMQGRANTGWSDTDYCAQMKALCLVNRSTRIFDTPSSVVTSEYLETLKKVTMGYMASLPVLDNIGVGSKIGPKSLAWQMLHLTMMNLYLRQSIEYEDISPDAHTCYTNALESAEQLVTAAEMLLKTGDAELLGYDWLAPGTWGQAGRSIYNLASRLERLHVGIGAQAGGEQDPRVGRLRAVGDKLTALCRIVAKRMPFAKVMAQKLENNARGSDEGVGLWARTDITS